MCNSPIVKFTNKFLTPIVLPIKGKKTRRFETCHQNKTTSEQRNMWEVQEKNLTNKDNRNVTCLGN